MSNAIRRHVTRFALALAAAGLAAGGGAQAQDVPEVVSPLRVESDPNGVNLVTGRMQVNGPVLSVPGAPNLRFDAVQNAAPYVRGTIQGQGGEYATASYSIHTGRGSSESFRCVDSDCTSITESGSNFTPGINNYREGNSGARYRFNLKHERTTTSNPNRMTYYASSVTFPNGEVISYTYETATLPDDPFLRTFYRPTRVSSNMGFSISIAYQGDVLGTAEWNSVSTAAIYNNSAPTTPLQRLTYASDGTITDLGGRTWTCSACANMLGIDLEVTSGTLQLPGETSTSLQVAPLSTAHPVVGSVTRDGVAWNYGYTNIRSFSGSFSGRWYDRITVTGPNGYNTRYDFRVSDRRNVLTRVTDSLDRVTTYDYDVSYRPIRIVYPEGNRIDIGYDGFGNIISRTVTAKPNSPLGAVTETLSYPTDDTTLCDGILNDVRCFRPRWSRDGLNRQTDYAYNDAGQLIQQIDPADANGNRRRTYIQYETTSGTSRRDFVEICAVTAGGPPAPCGAAAMIRTEYDYWNSTLLPTLERRIDVASGEVLETRYTYDDAGRRLSEDGPLAGTDDARYFRYDVHGRRTWEVGPRGANGLRTATRTNYRDADDKVTSVETGTLPTPGSTALTVLNRTDFAYDNRRNPVREAVSAGSTNHTVVQRTFDDRGRVECEARRMNPAAFASLPPSACTLGPQGTGAGDFGPDRITRNVYDVASQLLQVRRAVGTGAWEQAEVTNSYTPNGKRRYVVDANGNRAEFVYDGHDRLSQWRFPSTTRPTAYNPATPATALSTAGAIAGTPTAPTDYEAYGYDAVGNRTSLRKRDGTTIAFQYDGLNRVTVKTVPASATGAPGYSVHYDYDIQGLQLFARFGSASGPGITNDHDGFGRLVSSTNTTGGTSRSLSYLYDAGGRRSRLNFPDGKYFTYNYDAAGALTAIRQNGNTIIAAFRYDAAARFAGHNFIGATTSYEYDPIARLESLDYDLGGTGADQSLGLAYNPASQITARTSANDAYINNRDTNVTRNYTVNGLNQYTASGPESLAYDANGNLRSDGDTNFVYDAENRLVSASGATTAALAYDPLGRLFQTSGAAAGTVQFLYDGDELVAEYGDGGAVVRRYAHGIGTDDPVIWFEGPELNLRRNLFANHQGSIVAVSDTAGNALAINGYDAWGIPNAANQGRFQYTGQAWIPDLGMFHYKARLYSPTLGRFMQVDPVGYEDQTNLYAYVGNDPVNNTDSTGKAIDIIADIGFIVADVADISRNGLNWENGISLGANIVGAVIPGATGLGAGTRLISRGGDTAATATRTETRATRGTAGSSRPGTRGHLDHQDDVRGPGRLQAEAEARPGERVLTEERIQGHPGVNRRPDNQVVGTDGRTRVVVESERQPNGTYHRTREKQYSECGIDCQTRQLPRR